MIIYNIKMIPDLTLSKYQVFADSGVDGILEAQSQFIRQLYRVALLGRTNIHFLYDYDPKRKAGNKLRINVAFSGNEQDKAYYEKLRKIVRASGVSEYFSFCETNDKIFDDSKYTYMSVLRKKERILQTVIENEERYFYLVPNWEMKEDARLYSMIRLMESFDEKCCYRVDLYTEDDLEGQIHNSFERPLTFLRNISSKEQGLSEYSKIQKSRRDPNADETLRQYEDWLKAVDSSSVFRCRVCAFAKDVQYSQLLLNSTISESLKKGNVTIRTQQGDFTANTYLDDLPDGLHLQDTPKSLQNWATTFTVEEIAAFTRLPVLYDGENIEIPKETAAVQTQDGIVLGKDKNGYDVRISQKMLPKHMFVCGVPGSGKTNTMLHLANSLWNAEIENSDGSRCKLRIPFLVLEPAKREYRELALFDIPELLVFSPSACTRFPIRINPFEFPIGLTLSEHIGKLCQVFEGAFPIAPPAPFILDRAIQAVYEKRGWNVKDINTGTKSYPLMSELYEQFEQELLTTSYDSEIQGNIRSVLEMRIGSLLRREMKEIFDVPKSTLSPEEWLTKPVVIELESLGEGPANFVTLLLCTLIRETLKADPLKDKEKPIRHVIFIEEAHNLIAPESQISDAQDSNPKVAATAFIVKMLAEVRALREGIIIADQLPTAMAPEVIKNTNIKLVHRLTSQDDRELVGSTMSASPLQMENMATYTSGQALFTYEKLLRPFEMQVSLVEEHGESTPNDDELYELMMQKKDFYALREKEEDEKFQSLKQQIIELIEMEDKSMNTLLNPVGFSFTMELARFEKYMETCSEYLSGILQRRDDLIKAINTLSEQLISSEYIEEMKELAEKIGMSFEEKQRTFVKLYCMKNGG